MKAKHSVWLCVVGVVASCLVMAGMRRLVMPKLFGLIVRTGESGTGSMGAATQSQIENSIGIQFPDSTEWLGWSWDVWLDESFNGTFRASREDVVKMFDIEGLEWSKEQRYIFTNEYSPKWLTPDSIKQFQSFEAIFPSMNTVLRVVVDDLDLKKDGDEVTVFIKWHST